MLTYADTLITIDENEIKSEYIQLYYTDKIFKYHYITTDEWWYNEWLPNSHNFLSLEVFVNQLYAISLKYNNPSLICFSIGIYSVKLSEGRLSYSHEDNPDAHNLDDIISVLNDINNTGDWNKDNNSCFIGDCDIIIMLTNKRKKRKQRTHIPKGMRHEVFKRDNYTCVECGAKKDDGITLHIDHIIPVSKGGTDELDNLQTLCADCNLNKSNLIQQ